MAIARSLPWPRLAAALPWPRESRHEAALAWATWAALSLAAGWLVLSYGFPLPYADEMELLPYSLAEQPVTLAWLWSPHNEHRIFLPRLLYLGLTRLTGGDLRLAALYNPAALAAAAALLMLAARRLRGHTRWCDACLPLALLHWSHAINLLWLFQSAFATSTALLCLAVWAIARCESHVKLDTAVVVSICLAGMALCGANGIAFVPAMCGWLAVGAIKRWRHGCPRDRCAALVIMPLAALPLALVVFYFVDFTVISPDAPDPGLWRRLATSLQMLTTCLGSAAGEVWPVSGLFILAGLALSTRSLVSAWKTRPGERVRTEGLAALMCGQLALAAGIGWGRAAFGSEAGLTGRYILLATPLWCLWYLQAVAHCSSGECDDRPRARPGFVPRAMFVLMCLLLAVNMRKGLRHAIDFDTRFAALAADIRAGLPPAGLASRHKFLYPVESVLAVRLESLRRAGFGAFAESDPIGPLHAAAVVPLLATPASGEASGTFHLAGGQRLTRRFHAPAEGVISRIDVPINRWRRGKGVSTLDWTLSGVRDGRVLVLRQGVASLMRLRGVRSLTLDFAATPLHWQGELELSIQAPPSEPAGLSAQLPTFSQPDGSQQLNALLFVQPAAGFAQAAPAQRR